MTAKFDSAELHAELVQHGHIIPVGVRGAFGRGPVFEDVIDRFNTMVSDLARDDGAETRTFPPIVSRKVIEKHGYLESFPHLCGSVFSYFGDDKRARDMSAKAARGESWSEFQEQTDVCLAPAICYPLYATLAGTIPARGGLYSLLGWAYRHEPSDEPTRMQSFRMREFVRVGTAEQVVEWRDMWLERGLKLLIGLGLDARSDVAADPFFGRVGKMLAANQKQQKLKFEVLVPVISLEEPTAVCSFNFHQDHFASKWEIRTASGEIANTACLGFGLERLAMALFKTHGMDTAKWPSEVRRQLWSEAGA
jgi:seryl-tRNA synthetase